MGNNLVIDVNGGVVSSGKALDLWSEGKNPDAHEQLWKFVPAEQTSNPNGYIQSFQGQDLVIDTAGEKTTQGDLLDINQRGSGKTQRWSVTAAPGNTYDAKITGVVPATGGFKVTGQGFQLATQVSGKFSYTDQNDSLTHGPLTAITDLSGQFESTESGVDLTSSGTLVLDITQSQPKLSKNTTMRRPWQKSPKGERHARYSGSSDKSRDRNAS